MASRAVKSRVVTRSQGQGSRVVSIKRGHCRGLVPRMARASNAIAEHVWVANPDGFAYASPNVRSWMRYTSSIGQSCARQAALVSLVQSGSRHSGQGQGHTIEPWDRATSQSQDHILSSSWSCLLVAQAQSWGIEGPVCKKGGEWGHESWSSHGVKG